jgi:hypothetical protein
VTATSSEVQVVVREYCSQDVIGPFWTDVYLDPVEAPIHAGQLWPEVAFHGLAWGASIEALPSSTLTCTPWAARQSYSYVPQVAVVATIAGANRHHNANRRVERDIVPVRFCLRRCDNRNQSLR